MGMVSEIFKNFQSGSALLLTPKSNYRWDERAKLNTMKIFVLPTRLARAPRGWCL